MNTKKKLTAEELDEKFDNGDDMSNAKVSLRLMLPISLRKKLLFILCMIYFGLGDMLAANETIRIGKINPYKSSPDKGIEDKIIGKLTEQLRKANFQVVASASNGLDSVKEAKKEKEFLCLDIYYTSKAKSQEVYILIYDPNDESLVDSLFYSSRFKVPEEIELPEDEISTSDPKLFDRFVNNLLNNIQLNPKKAEFRENIEINFLRTPLSKEIVYKLRKAEEGQKAKEVMQLLNPTQETASKRDEKLNDAPASMTIITKADIEKYGYKSLPEALSRVPEVYVHYNGHNHSADFRGFFVNNVERRTLYLLNGHRLNDRFHFGGFYK